MDGIELGQVAYEAYLTSCDGRPGDEAFHRWGTLPPEARERWRTIADGVKMFLEMRGQQVTAQ